MKQLLSALQQLGFSEHEGVLYLALLPHPGTTTGLLIKETGLHRNIVYETLERLVQKRFIFQTIQSGRKRFSARDPEVIRAIAREQVQLAERIFPDLKARARGTGQEILVYEGVEGFNILYKHLFEGARLGSTYYVIGAAGKRWHEAMGGDENIKRFNRMADKKKIRIKLLSFKREGREIRALGNIGKATEIRVLPESYRSLANTSIFEDHTLISIFGEPPVLIDIRNRVSAQAHLQHFTVLWKKAKKLH